jgi:SAM-dependent methyltransferase
MTGNGIQKEQIPCPVCGCEQYHVLYEPWIDVSDPSGLYGAASGVQGTQQLVRCLQCTLIYENPRFPGEAIVRAYTAASDTGHDTQHATRVASFCRALIALRKRLPPPGSRVLDIGTAGGAFLEAAQQLGYDAYGLEPSLDLVEKGRHRNLRISQGTIEDNPFEDQSFELVCMWDVLEHLPNPKAALFSVQKLLSANGMLLINFPDIGTWQARAAGKHFWWITSVHLQHFTRDTVAKICRLTGFDVFHFRPYWQTLEFGYLEHMAAHYGMPGANFIERFTPKFLRTLPVSYYASQTTALARLIQ